MNVITKTIDLGEGKVITIETGKLAKQADGSVVVKMGKTMLLAAVVAAKDPMANADFMPLSVEYKEKFGAIGRFPGSFMRREARPSDNEILIARLVDRALRPMFPDDFHAETFVTINLISADLEVPPDALAGLAASAALAVSDIPFNGPISEVRVARIDGEFEINPCSTDLKRADIDMIVAGTLENVVMVEGEMKEVAEADMIDAIAYAHEAIKIQCKAQLELMEAAGTTKKREYCHEVNNADLKQKVWDETYQKTYAIAKQCIADKHLRSESFHAVEVEFLANFPSEEDGYKDLVAKYFHDVHKEAVRNLILDEGLRLDGRKGHEIRHIWSEVDYLPSAHGSALFTRGETQSLTTVTLGNKMDEKIVDEVMNQGYDRFLLHYNFPPFSTGDARASRGTSRREIGHGNLAHRALKQVLPADNFPYALRIVSDILESNGSSSMATVCAGTLALMDAGVQISRPVSGIAMGLITRDDGKWAVLSDILGDEDHLGDMDFKVTGTDRGITATQMDIKVKGLSFEIMAKALEQARDGRMHILGKILETLQAPRTDYKPHTPRIERIIIPKDMIGAVIGPGGKIIQEIQATTNSTITIDEVDNQGIVDIFAVDKAAIDGARKRIMAIVAIPEEGAVYKGIVKSIQPYGAFVEFMAGRDGLLHISEIEHRRLETVSEVLKEGDEIDVKLVEIDKKTGKFKLSRKVLLPRPEGRPQEGPRHGKIQVHQPEPHPRKKHDE